jgi:GAF domain-containing protein
VLVDDLTVDRRWLEWTQAVADLPIRSVVSAPLVAGRECIGALKVYAGTPGAYDAGTARLLELFAGPAATLLAHIQASEAPHRISAGLTRSLHSRDLINRACGILMERHRLAPDAALRELMRLARDRNATLLQVSADLVAGIPAARE